MKSKWYELKEGAVKLRKKGLSLGKIESRLGVPKSTLSGWFKDVELSEKQKKKLYNDWKNALVRARIKAVAWHNKQKEQRLLEAKKQAIETLGKINIDNKNIIELALALLYLGEGAKNNPETALGSSNPLILKFFLSIIKNVYGIENDKIKCELGLRADQDPWKIKKFWAKSLNLPIENFHRINVDKRTIGSKTYPHYKGVCHIRCGNSAVQRKLIYLANSFCEKIIENNQGRIA